MSIIGGLIQFGGGGTGSGGETSGITSINSQTGPAITINSPDSTTSITSENNTISLSASGTVQMRAYNFTNITSGQFFHGYGSRDVQVQVQSNDFSQDGQWETLLPDLIIFDTLDEISLTFNSPISGRVVLVGNLF